MRFEVCAASAYSSFALLWLVSPSHPCYTPSHLSRSESRPTDSPYTCREARIMGFDNLSLYPDIFLGPAIDLARDDEIDDALEVALAQYEFISVSRLSFEQSLRLQRREQYSLAAEYSGFSLDTWRIHFDGASEESLAVARPTELRILNTAAVHNFNKGDYNATIDLIQQARRLAALMPPTPLLASTEWNTALMERWRGDYSKALQHAQTALQIYHA